MKNRTILFVLNSATTDADVNGIAQTASAQANHLICLLVNAAPPFPMYISPYGGGIPENWTEIVSQTQDALDTRTQEIKALLSAAGASGDVQSALCTPTDIKHTVSRFACVSDEVVFADNLRDAPDTMREAASGVLFHSPVGLRVNGSALHTPSRIFVAWNSTPAASAALHAALAYLKEAQEVVIACFDPTIASSQHSGDPGVDVAAWLSHHGCKVTVSQFPSGGLEIGRCIQDRAQEVGADLIVMGAYGHARMIQTVLGGTTRTMIDQTDMPILLAH